MISIRYIHESLILSPEIWVKHNQETQCLCRAGSPVSLTELGQAASHSLCYLSKISWQGRDTQARCSEVSQAVGSQGVRPLQQCLAGCLCLCSPGKHSNLLAWVWTCTKVVPMRPLTYLGHSNCSVQLPVNSCSFLTGTEALWKDLFSLSCTNFPQETPPFPTKP